MPLSLSLLITIASVSFAFGMAVYFSNRKSPVNRIFFIFALVITVWIISFYLVDHPIKASLALFWNRLNFATAISVAITLLYFSFVFPLSSKEIFLYKKIFTGSAIIFLGFILFSKWGISSIEFKDWGTNAISGPLFIYSIFLSVFCILWMVCNLVRSYRHGDKDEKLQLKFLFIGIIISAVIGLTNSALLPLISGSYQYAIYTPYSMVILLGFTFYAIVKHHFMDIRVILTEIGAIIITVAIFMQTLSSKNTQQLFINSFIFLLVLYGSYVLIKSVQQEIMQRVRIEKLAKELETANNHLKEVDKLKDDFLSMASHELNTPIAAIKGYLSMILVEGMGGKIPDKARTYLDTVYTSAERLANMVKDLLNVSRIESGRIHIIWEQKPIEEIINQSITEVMSKAREAGHTLTFEAPRHKMPSTWFDSTRVTEIVINMLGNSIKYTPNGGKITVRAVHDEDKIVVSVEDNGKGIPRNRQRVVFEKFSQVDVLKDEVKGTGLGMYIAKKFIELHKGKIWFHSDGEGKGTTFFFFLPILKDKPFDAHEGQDAVLH